MAENDLAFWDFAERNAYPKDKLVVGQRCYIAQTNDNPPKMGRQEWNGTAWVKGEGPIDYFDPNAEEIQPPEEVIPPKPPNEQDTFKNPFNKMSAAHRPIGLGARTVLLSSIANVKGFRTGRSKQGRKYTYQAKTSDPQRTIKAQANPPSNCKLPYTLKMPVADYPSTDGDDVVQICRVPTADDHIADLFFNFEDAASSAKRRYEYSLRGTDVADGSDNWDRGSSASGVRFHGVNLNGVDINSATPGPILHCLNVTATRHTNAGAKPSSIILGKTKVWPAYYMDSGASDPGANTGRVPYGARILIDRSKWHLRDTLGLSPRGLVMFDQMCTHGFYVLDGQGQEENDGGVFQMRLAADVSDEACDDLDRQLPKLLPLLFMLENPRPLDRETEVWTDGLPYAGGGGPLGPGSINTAWDA